MSDTTTIKTALVKPAEILRNSNNNHGFSLICSGEFLPSVQNPKTLCFCWARKSAHSIVTVWKIVQ